MDAETQLPRLWSAFGLVLAALALRDLTGFTAVLPAAMRAKCCRRVLIASGPPPSGTR